MILTQTKYCLVSGAGDGAASLTAFDRALLSAGAGGFNLVKVTSILPPRATVGDLRALQPGQIVYAALGSLTSDVNGELISAAVAVAVPKDNCQVGVLMEGSFKTSEGEAEERVRVMARQALVDRGIEILRVESCSSEWRVQKVGAVVAAVLLWD